MKKAEEIMKYRLVSGDTLICETNSLPKMAKFMKCSLMEFYKTRPKDKTINQWDFKYKGYIYTVIKLNTPNYLNNND